MRTYAAAAARRLGDLPTLYRLAHDANPNVVAAAIDGLSVSAGHDADSVYIDALESNDDQLIRSATSALRGSHDSRALLALSTALERLSALRRETTRDGRVALLDRIKEFGGAPVAAALAPYLVDIDSVVATRAADDVEAWTGRRPRVTPHPLPPIAPPDFADLATLEQTRVTIEMEDGSTFSIELHAVDAPTNSARFVRLARAGYFNGLTFHRVVPFFVVQGGSPDANEYAGDSLFTRDEVGVENTRGSVGVSTRGHDTGDGLVYINVVDNATLDHEYTVFACGDRRVGCTRWDAGGCAHSASDGSRARRHLRKGGSPMHSEALNSNDMTRPERGAACGDRSSGNFRLSLPDW